MADLAFRFLEVSDSSGYVSSLANAMQYYELPQVLVHGFVYEAYDPQLISRCIAMLTVDTAVLTVVSQSVAPLAQMKEMWYGTQYGIRKFTPQENALWATSSIAAELHLPEQNRFLPTDFKILHPGERQRTLELPKTFPKVILNSPVMRVWHKLDDTFFTPRVIVGVSIYSNEMAHAARPRLLADIMLRLFHLSVAEETYQGGLAGLAYSIDSSGSGLSLGFSGYNQRMGEWIERLVRKFAAFKADAEQLVVVLDEVVRGHRSFNQSQPYSQGMYYAGLMIYPDKFPNEEYLRILTEETPTAADVDAFHAQLLAAESFTEAFVHGNVLAPTAIDWCNEIHSLVKGGALAAKDRPIPQAREWKGEHVYAVNGLSPADPNAALISVFSAGTFDTRRALVLGLLASVLNEPTYNQLRTIEQLGYLVFSGASIHAAEDTMGFYIAVQSPWSEPGNMSHSVETLVHGTLDAAVRGLSDEHFERERSAVIANKLAPFEDLSQEAGFYAGEIGLHRYDFNRPRADVDILKQVEKTELIDMFTSRIDAADPALRSSFSVWVYPPARDGARMPSQLDLPATTSRIESSAAFVREHPRLRAPKFPWDDQLAGQFVQQQSVPPLR